MHPWIRYVSDYDRHFCRFANPLGGTVAVGNDASTTYHDTNLLISTTYQERLKKADILKIQKMLKSTKPKSFQAKWKPTIVPEAWGPQTNETNKPPAATSCAAAVLRRVPKKWTHDASGAEISWLLPTLGGWVTGLTEAWPHAFSGPVLSYTYNIE